MLGAPGYRAYAGTPLVGRDGLPLGTLRKALDNQEFVPFFQPVVDLRSGAVVGLEALVRWQPPAYRCGLARQGVRAAL